MEEDTGLIKVSSLHELVDHKTACVIVVHLNGLAVDTRQVAKIVGDIPIIEDACQAFGSGNNEGTKIGKDSKFSCFSFGVTKLITCGQGGCFATNSDEINGIALRALNIGVDSLKDPRYLSHGLNLKVGGLSSLMLEAQLKLFEDNKTKVWEIYQQYKAGLDCSGIKFPNRSQQELPLYTQVIMPPEEKQSLMVFLQKEGIETRPAPKPYDSAEHLKNIKVVNKSSNSATQYANSLLYLPSGPGQDSDDISIVIKAINYWRMKL